MIHRVSEHGKPEIGFFRYPQALYGERTHRSSEKLNGTVDSSQHTVPAHNLKHMIETWPNSFATHRNSSGMDQITCLASDFFTQVLQCRFEICRRPNFQRCVRIPKRPKARHRSGFTKTLPHRALVKRESFSKEKINPTRHFLKELDLLFDYLKDPEQIVLVADINSGCSDKRVGQLAKSVERHGMDILAIQPITFIQVKRRILSVDLRQVEKLDHLVDTNHFPIVFG